jgi:hypothetical protein
MATTTFNDLITFSRGSNATVTGPNGLIQWAPSNLVTNSQDFEAAGWTKNSSTITANSAVAPDGTQTADTWTPTSTATTAGVRLLGSFTVTSGSIQTASIYVKSAGKRWFFLTTPSAASANDNCWFDLQNGVVGTIGSSALSATMTAVGNGWYRVTTTSVAASATNYIFVSTTTGDNTTAVTADGTGVYIWGAQLELGSTATTYNNTSVRNLLGFSEAFDNAAWQKLSASIVTGAQANPVNGLFNAQKLMEDTSTGIHRTFQTATLVVAPYTFSFYAKPAGRDWLYINVSGAAHTAFVNIATGAVGATVGSPTVTMTPLSGGWYRVAMTYSNASAGASNQQIWLASNSTTTSYTGDGNSGVYIYGAMLSNSASLDPYVPTPGAAPSSTAYYGPRFDYDPVTRAARGLLVEEARTNLLTYSEQFDNAAWTKSSCTVTANQGTAPDGTNTLTLLQFSAQFGRLQQGSLTSGTVYTFSIWCRVASGTRVYSLYDALGNPLGSFTATTTLTRYSVTFTAPATSTLYAVQDRNAGPFVDTFIWGAQLEAGAFATTYIPTIASTVTRSADVATITGSLFSQWYNQSEGAVIADFATFVPSASFNASTPIAMSINDNTTNNRIDIFNGGVTTYTRINIGVGGVSQAVLDTVPAISSGKASAAYAVNNFASSVAGGAVVTDNSGSLPVVSQLQLGALTTAARLNGWLRSIRYVPVRAADFQLQQVTT